MGSKHNNANSKLRQFLSAYNYIIGMDEAGRPQSGRASPHFKYLIGIDEAGRGPLAGPLVVAGVRLRTPATTSNAKFKIKNEKLRNIFNGIKDSKKLSAKRREEWFKILTGDPCVKWAVAKISPKVIDKINIAKSANLGAKRVFQKLSGGKSCYALLDGSLYLPKHINYKTIIKGDEKIPIISAASIIAKVTRDRIMARLHKKYPLYGFDAHKGYGTKFHYGAIKKLGLLNIHRRSFNLKQ